MVKKTLLSIKVSSKEGLSVLLYSLFSSMIYLFSLIKKDIMSSPTLTISPFLDKAKRNSKKHGN